MWLARSDAGRGAVSVDTAACVHDRAEMWRPLADERGVRLAVEVESAATARAGPQRLVQVLDNLVANALDHAPAGTTVTISADGAPPWVELRVRDEGAGMTPEQRARAFDGFWRATSGPGGSGLGLAIVRKLVEADGGEIELAPAPGGGTDAVVRLRRA